MRPRSSYPINVSFDGLERSDELEASILDQAEGLFRFHPRIHRVDVIVTQEGHKQRGNRFRVQVNVAIPGNDVVVGRHHAGHEEHEDPYIAAHDSFRAAARKLEDTSQLRRGEVKREGDALQPARIAALEADHGFLETEDGGQVYFHRNSVMGGGFEELRVGAAVRFAEEEGEQGPQASTVHVVRGPATADVAAAGEPARGRPA